MKQNGVKALALKVLILLTTAGIAFAMSGCPGGGGGGGNGTIAPPPPPGPHPEVVVDCPATVDENASAVCTLTATAPAGTVAPLSCFVAAQSTCTGAVITDCTQVSIPPQGESAGGGSCILAVGVQDSTSPPILGGNFDTITINKVNQDPTFSQNPKDVYVSLNSVYNHDNGVGADVDLPNASPGDDGYLTCSWLAHDCPFTVTITGSGNGTVNCSLSFTAPAAPATCNVTLQVSDGNGWDVLAYFDIHATNVRYVDANATGAGTGLNWTDAFTTIQAAMAAASSGDSVWVKDGNYDSQVATDEYVLKMKSNVSVFGGFSSGTETSIDDRQNPIPMTTILDGKGAKCHVVYANGGYQVLDGFRITGGISTAGPNCTYPGGAGIYNRNVLSAQLNNLYIDHNYTTPNYMGGGIKNSGSELIIGNSILSYNYGDGGGGMYNDNSYIQTVNTDFIQNEAHYRGGGISNVSTVFYAYGGTLSGNQSSYHGGAISNMVVRSYLNDLTLSYNTATYCGGGIQSAYSKCDVNYSTLNNNYSTAGTGGAVCVRDVIMGMYPSMFIYRSNLSYNSALSAGGAIYGYNTRVTVSNSQIHDNWASLGSGGGIHTRYKYLTVDQTDVDHNYALNDGGGIYSYHSNSQILNSNINNNTSGLRGGGINLSAYNDGYIGNSIIQANNSSYGGGGVRNYASSLKVVDSDFLDNVTSADGGAIHNYAFDNYVLFRMYWSTLSGNTANKGGAIFNSGYFGDVPTVAVIYDSIISDNASRYEGAGIFNYYTYSYIENSIISDNSSINIAWPTYGGGITNRFHSQLMMDNSIISSNTAFIGGGIYNYNYSSIELTGNTIANNAASHAGAINNWDANALIASCILWNDWANSYDEIYNVGGTVTINYSDVAGGYSGTNNINNDPLFANAPKKVDFTVDPGGFSVDTIKVPDASLYLVGDVIEIGNDGVARAVTAAAGVTVTFSPALDTICDPYVLIKNWGPGATNLVEDFHIAPPSPAVDSGAPIGSSNDIEGNPRPSGTDFDMGAYEYQWP